MSKNQKKIPFAKALDYTDRFIKLIQPHIIKAEIAGSVRRQCALCGDVEIVCIEDPEHPLSELFHKAYPGIVKNGPRMKSFKYGSLSVELYIAQPYDYGRILAIRTGSSAFSHIKLAQTWWRLGWAGTLDGLRKRSECTKKGGKWIIKDEYKDNPSLPPVFETEYDFFNFLGIEWLPPERRSWKSKDEKLNYSV